MDMDSLSLGGQLKVHGRIMPPLGWYDERAKEKGELRMRGMLGSPPGTFMGLALCQ